MKHHPKLWLLKEKSNRTWYYVGEPVCEDCGGEALLAYYFSNWAPRHHFERLLCSKCARDAMKMNMNMQTYKLVHVRDEPPPGSIIGGNEYPGLTNSSNMTTFETATKNIGGEETIDRTKLSGRTEKAVVEYIGDPKAITSDKEENLHTKEIDEFLQKQIEEEEP